MNKMRKVFLLVLVGVLIYSCDKNRPYEVIGAEGRKPFYPEVPTGMTYIPAGGFTMGLHEQDMMQVDDARAKVVTISAFYMDQTEISTIFIDQIVLGSYAMAAMEAMCYGKPVIAYILPVLLENGINNECPIVNATHLTLESELEKLICNPELRFKLGKESRQYVEKYHDADILSKELYRIYTNEFYKKK